MKMQAKYTEIKYLRDIEDRTWTYIGNAVSLDRRTVKKWYEAGSNTAVRLISEQPIVDTAQFQPMVADGDMLVTCDWHIPLHDPIMVNNVINKAHEENIKTLVIGGDYWDMTSYSHFAPHQREAPFEVERSTGLEIMDALTDTFDEILVFWGNHDWRFMRINEFKFSFKYGMEMLFQPLGKKKLAKLTFSNLDHMYLEQFKEFRFNHQTNFSKIPLTVPRTLAQKYHCSIITAHSHHCAMGVALDGENIIIEGGGLFDKKVTEYIQKTTTHHDWVQGYTMFKNGIPTLFSPLFGNI